MAKGLRSAGAIQFFVSDGGSPTSWAQLGEVVDLQEGARLGVAEASNLDSVAAEYIAALAENGLTLTIMYRPDVAVQQTLKNARRLGTRLEFKILFVASGITTVFFGFVTDFETLAKVGKMLVGDLAIKMDTRETEVTPIPPLVPSTEKILLHFNGADGATTTTDEYGNPVTLQDIADLATTYAKFGVSCLDTYWVDDTHPDAGARVDDVTLGASGWTIECFVMYPTVVTTTYLSTIFFAMRGAVEYGALVRMDTFSAQPNKRIYVQLSSSGSSWNIDSGATPSSNIALNNATWYHLALVRDNNAGAYYLYWNGAAVYTKVSALQISGITKLLVGTGAGRSFRGYIDEFRLSNVCRYPGGTTFTPTTEAFTS